MAQPAWLRFDDGGVMTADVVKGAELAVFATDDQEWFVVDVDGEELSGLFHLIEAAHDLPVTGEDSFAFELRDAGVEIPWRGDGGGFFKGIDGVV